MITFFSKGEIKLSIYKFNIRVSTYNIETQICDCIDSDELVIHYKKQCLDEIYKIFESKIQELSDYLQKKDIKNWNTKIILETGKEKYKELNDKYIYDNRYKNNLSDEVFRGILDKVKANFREISEDAEDEIEKYSEFYDFLSDMFMSIEEVIEYEIEKKEKIYNYNFDYSIKYCNDNFYNINDGGIKSNKCEYSKAV